MNARGWENVFKQIIRCALRHISIVANCIRASQSNLNEVKIIKNHF